MQAVLVALCLSGWIDAPEPSPIVAAWPGGLMEVRVAFSRPIGDTIAADTVADKTITFGDPAPGGVAEETGGTLRVASSRWIDGGRTLVLATDPHPARSTYRLKLTLPGRRVETVPYSFAGVSAAFAPEKGDAIESAWWPLLSMKENRRRLAGSTGHDRLDEAMKAPGKLTVRTMVALPAGAWTIAVESSGAIVDPSLGGEAGTVAATGGRSVATQAIRSSGEPAELAFDVETGRRSSPFSLSARANGGDSAELALSADRLFLPGSPPAILPMKVVADLPAHLRGGDPAKGEAVFFGEAGKCGTCHQRGDRGGAVGPDLSEIGKNGEARVYRDILEPGAAIRPDYVSFTASLADGRVLSGVVRSDGADRLRFATADGKSSTVLRSEVSDIRPSATSLMPVGLPGAIGEAGMRDLMAYLMSPVKAR